MKTSKAIAGIITAAAVGAAVGVAFAPDKGSKTRKKIKNQVDDLSDNARKMAITAKDKTVATASEIYDQSKKGLNNLVGKVTKTANEVEVV